MDDHFLGGLDSAGALRGGGVLARQRGAAIPGGALAGAGPRSGSPRCLGRVVDAGPKAEAAAGGGGDGKTGEDTYRHRGGFSLSKWVRALVARGKTLLRKG